MQNPLNFLRSVKQEIFKITWPTSKEALMGTVMVIAMAVVASLFFLLLDPLLIINSKTDKNLSWAIFVDNSASIKNHKTPSINSIKSAG